MSNPVIRFDRASLEIDGESILSPITATVERGRRVAIIGPSGAGKSTLLSLCNLMRTPTGGQVFFEEKEVRAWDTRALRQKIGMVFQTPTMFPGSVEDNLLYGLKLHHRKWMDAAEIVQTVGLSPDLLTKQADDISGGQKQRVALGRTLAMEPEVLLLDEVTSALDIQAKQEIEQTILAIHQRMNTTLLWVTHDLEQAKRVAEDVWFMNRGTIVEQGETQTVLTRPQSEELVAFLQQGEEVNS